MPLFLTESPNVDAYAMALRFTEKQQAWLHHHIRAALTILLGPAGDELCRRRLLALLDAVDARIEGKTIHGEGQGPAAADAQRPMRGDLDAGGARDDRGSVGAKAADLPLRMDPGRDHDRGKNRP